MEQKKTYENPEMEIVEFESDKVIATSNCAPYNCPTSYGSTCTGYPTN